MAPKDNSESLKSVKDASNDEGDQDSKPIESHKKSKYIYQGTTPHLNVPYGQSNCDTDIIQARCTAKTGLTSLR